MYKVGDKFMMRPEQNDDMLCEIVEKASSDYKLSCYSPNGEQYAVCLADDEIILWHLIKIDRFPWEEEKKPTKQCTCGAKYTSFPNKHMNWCDLK